MAATPTPAATSRAGTSGLSALVPDLLQPMHRHQTLRNTFLLNGYKLPHTNTLWAAVTPQARLSPQ